MGYKSISQYLRHSMFERVRRKGDNIKIYGYSASHDEHVHLASIKVNIPAHMQSIISSSDIEEELAELIRTQETVRQEIIKDKIKVTINEKQEDKKLKRYGKGYLS